MKQYYSTGTKVDDTNIIQIAKRSKICIILWQQWL